MNNQKISKDIAIERNKEAINPKNSDEQDSTKRRVGVLALSYASSLMVQNLLFAMTNAPSYSDSLKVVLKYHTENQRALSVAFGLETVNMVLFLLFITALHKLIKQVGSRGENWWQLAMNAGVTFTTLSAITIASHIAVVLISKNLIEPDGLLKMIWQLHAAVFAFSLPALGLTFIGIALATHINGLTNLRQRVFGIIGGTLPIIAGTSNLAIAEGAPTIYLGVLGLFIWLVWLIVMGVRLIRC